MEVDAGAERARERRLVLYNLGFFSTAESLTANNIVLAVYQHVTNPERASTCCARPSKRRSTPTRSSTAAIRSASIRRDVQHVHPHPVDRAKDAFVVDLTRTVSSRGSSPPAPPTSSASCATWSAST